MTTFQGVSKISYCKIGVRDVTKRILLGCFISEFVGWWVLRITQMYVHKHRKSGFFIMCPL